MKYLVKDTVTGNVCGDLTINDVSKMLNVKSHTIYRAVVSNKKINDRYVVKSCHDDYSRYYFPLKLLNEWDRVCSKFRVYYSNMEVKK